MSRYWYFYDGTGPTSDPGNYTRTGVSVGICPSGGTPCAIYAHPSDATRTSPLGSELATGSNIRSYFAIVAANPTLKYPVAPNVPFVYYRGTF